jgi:hypothetical protein
MGSALEEPVPLEAEEVVMHRGSRCETDNLGDLPDRRWITALFDRPGNALEDALSPFGVVPGQDLLRADGLSERLAEHVF